MWEEGEEPRKTREEAAGPGMELQGTWEDEERQSRGDGAVRAGNMGTVIVWVEQDFSPIEYASQIQNATESHYIITLKIRATVA